LGYIITSVIGIVAVAVGVAVLYVRHENRPTHRPSLTRRAAARSRRVAAGDLCVCGGTIGKTGQISSRLGEILGCTGCARSWTIDGRRIIRRHPGASRQRQGPAD
jgi:hypothetical protein